MFAAQVSNGVVTRAIVTDAVPDGWIGSDTRIGVGWSWDGATFSPPPPPAPPTPQELEAAVQEVADALTAGSERDKAMAFVLADLVAKAFNLSTQEARGMVRDRFVAHLRTIKGL